MEVAGWVGLSRDGGDRLGQLVGFFVQACGGWSGR